VCIPVVSSHGLIERCLKSIVDSHPSVDTEIVVVANGLPDSELRTLRNRDDIVLISCAVNTGFSGGNNLAARFARGRYLLLLNDDSIVEAGYVNRLLRVVDGDPAVAAACGRILSADGTLQEAGSVLWSDGWVAHAGAGLPADSPSYAHARDVDYASANGLLVKREAWDKVGGLDERYFPAYYEDVDLCLALVSHGYRVVYEPEAELRHLESQSTAAPFRGFLLVRNRAQLVAKWGALLQQFPDRPEVVDAGAVDAAVRHAGRSESGVLDGSGGDADTVPAGRMTSATHDAWRPDGDYVAAEARIRDEYIAYLEDEMARLESVIDESDVAFERLVDAFDEKERYINSLLSVRAKKWIFGRLPGRKY
jgi:GT2 family glycosyltransferase